VSLVIPSADPVTRRIPWRSPCPTRMASSWRTLARAVLSLATCRTCRCSRLALSSTNGDHVYVVSPAARCAAWRCRSSSAGREVVVKAATRLDKVIDYPTRASRTGSCLRAVGPSLSVPAQPPRAPMFLSDVSIRRPVFTAMMCLCLIVLG